MPASTASTLPRICISTGTRADYGLLYWLIRDLEEHPGFDLSVVASAMHLAPEFGNTIDFIRKDGVRVDAEVPCLSSDDSDLGMARAFSKAVDGFTDAFLRLKPDLVVLLGDRFEALAAATAATFLHIPIAHLHGGEKTLGAVDEIFRHSITKMAHLHFTAAEDYRHRVIQMGEHPNRVFNVGAIGLDNFTRLDLLSKPTLLADLGFAADADFALITYHPATMNARDPLDSLDVLLAACGALPDMNLVITKANSDPGGRRINDALELYAQSQGARVKLTASLGQKRYLSAMQHAALVIGNSSSGIIEAPAVNVPTINIGDRQDGRLTGESVIHVTDEVDAIEAAFGKALSPAFREGLPRSNPPYGRPSNTTKQIIEILEQCDLTTLHRKDFYDTPRQHAR